MKRKCKKEEGGREEGSRGGVGEAGGKGGAGVPGQKE